MLTGLWLRQVALAASALLLVFFGGMLRSYAKGLEIDCACFGFGEALSQKTILRDGVLLLPSMALAALAFRRASYSAKQT